VGVPVSLLEDTDVVKQTLSSVATNHPLVLAEPQPLVRLDAIRDSELQFTLVAWIRDPPVAKRIASELRYAIIREFARAGVRFPTPELLVHTGRPPSRQESQEITDREPEPPL
jgi:small-conductance mechanosensitive channel